MGEKVLLVDDDEKLRKLLREYRRSEERYAGASAPADGQSEVPE